MLSINLKASVGSQRFQKASGANQKATVTAKGTLGLLMMDDKKEKRQKRICGGERESEQ